jgi:hypothetical protein
MDKAIFVYEDPVLMFLLEEFDSVIFEDPRVMFIREDYEEFLDND